MTIVLERKPQQAAAETIHVVVADGQAGSRAALRQTLAAALGDVAVREAGDVASLIGLLRADEPVDIVLLDPATPGVSGVSGLLYLRSQYPHVPFALVSRAEDHDVMRRCIALGAAGFIPASLDASGMRDAVRMVLGGEISAPADVDGLSGAPDAAVTDTMRRLNDLTPQQLRVLMMVSEGLLNKQIAYALSVSEATVKAHVSAVLQKLGVNNRTHAVAAVSRIDGDRCERAAATR